MIGTMRTLLLAAAATSQILTGTPATAAEYVTFCESGRVWGHWQATQNATRFYDVHVEHGFTLEELEHGYNRHHFDVIPPNDVSGEHNWDAVGQAMFANECVGPDRPANDRPGGAIRLEVDGASDTQFTYHAAYSGEALVEGDTDSEGAGPGGFGICSYTFNPDGEYMGRSVWYTARGTRSGEFTVTATSPDWARSNSTWYPDAPYVAAYTRTDGVFTPVAEWCGESSLRFATTRGTKYWIQVGGYSWYDYGHVTTQIG
jgi:hypothetical protein